MMMLTVFGDGYRRHWGIVLAVDVRSIFRWAPAVVEERTCPTSEQIRTTVTVHIAKLPAVHFWQTMGSIGQIVYWSSKCASVLFLMSHWLTRIPHTASHTNIILYVCIAVLHSV